MAWFSLLSLAAKTGLHVYQNRQNQKKYMSDAALLHAERMAQGKIEYKGQVLTSHEKGFKDEIVLFIIILPIILIAWSVFSGDPAAQEKLDLFFFYFNNLPTWFVWLTVGIFGSIYGLKPGLNMFKKK
ncbi:MAG: hypothetical protein COB63_05370 [Candidatus Pelagibacter sp.]|jgi:uncharacterized ion transporter superfamily protein YfcC|nr:MAG: hypothetical protein COB63_05370 [Candidatus Pelagibacter sp.]